MMYLCFGGIRLQWLLHHTKTISKATELYLAVSFTPKVFLHEISVYIIPSSKTTHKHTSNNDDNNDPHIMYYVYLTMGQRDMSALHEYVNMDA